MTTLSPDVLLAQLGDMPTEAREVLQFWFVETDPMQHFRKESTFDTLIRERFSSLMQRLIGDKAQGWRASPGGALAACILIDQFPRNVYRDTPEAFANDTLARELARHIRDQKLYLALSAYWQTFCFLPLMHSEDIADQDECVRLGQEVIGLENFIDYAQKHRVIIARFGRFPHRNAILGRPSSTEEIAFLQEADSSF